jgi:hypothetical protein
MLTINERTSDRNGNSRNTFPHGDCKYRMMDHEGNEDTGEELEIMYIDITI